MNLYQKENDLMDVMQAAQMTAFVLNSKVSLALDAEILGERDVEMEMEIEAVVVRLDAISEAETIKQNQHCRVGRVVPDFIYLGGYCGRQVIAALADLDCSKGLCNPEHVRSRKERCTGCGKIE